MVNYIGGQRGSIYLVTQLSTGKQYVGQTTMSLRERWRHHRRARSEAGDCLGDVIGESSDEDFSIQEIAVAYSSRELDELERYYILQYDTLSPSGFNLTPGGHAFSKSGRHAERVSLSKIGLKFTDNPKPIKSSTRPRCRKNKMVVDRKKPVIGTHLVTGEVIELTGVSMDSRFDPRLVSACCRGKRRHHRGFAWRYKNGA